MVAPDLAAFEKQMNSWANEEEVVHSVEAAAKAINKFEEKARLVMEEKGTEYADKAFEKCVESYRIMSTKLSLLSIMNEELRKGIANALHRRAFSILNFMLINIAHEERHFSHDQKMLHVFDTLRMVVATVKNDVKSYAENLESGKYQSAVQLLDDVKKRFDNMFAMIESEIIPNLPKSRHKIKNLRKPFDKQQEISRKMFD